MKPALVTVAISAMLATTLSACDADNRAANHFQRPAPELRLTSFDSCDTALADLKTAATKAVGPYGFAERSFGDNRAADSTMSEESDKAASAPEEPANTQDSYSGTNNHERGVDEADIVKTDGERIYVVNNQQLSIIDADSRQIVGDLDLSTDGYYPSQLLLGDDRALIVLTSGYTTFEDSGSAEPGIAPDTPSPEIAPVPVATRIVSVSLTGQPAIDGTLTIDGDYLDARQVDDTVRLVTRSSPTIDFAQNSSDGDEATAANKRLIAESTIDDWLPHYELATGGAKTTGRVSCENVSHPAQYSGSTLLSVFTFQLDAALNSGDPVTIAADGGTVYATSETLYVANQAALIGPMPEKGDVVEPSDLRTEVYAFTIKGRDLPAHVASGWVPGMLLNQYSMSEHDGHLRIATTHFDNAVTCCEREPETSSSVYVLRRDGAALTDTGSVHGLGDTEMIRAVRFLGPVGYVVTFRQTDPLYTIDLSDPESPKVLGELKITGYSAYLHPVKEGRILGVGQEADTNGRVQGLKVSLFDVDDLAEPKDVSNYQLANSGTAAEFDPHAFLYWDETGTIVIPVTSYIAEPTMPREDSPDRSESSPSNNTVPGQFALVLTVKGDELVETARIVHDQGYLQRSLVVGDTLWTISDAGALATDMATYSQHHWVAF